MTYSASPGTAAHLTTHGPGHSLKPCPKCAVLHRHPTRDLCMRCSGWACPTCGRPKSPEQECRRQACKRSRAAKVAKVVQETKRTSRKVGTTTGKPEVRTARLLPLVVPGTSNP